jgi:signal transduction histidine kinase
MMAITDGAIKTMRRIITDLRPSVLDDLGLVAAVEWQLREFQVRMGIKTVLELGLAPDVASMHFDERIAVAAFRIMQEALTNIARHAGAGRVLVALAVEDDTLLVTIQDDGCGVDGKQWSKRGSYGILGMHERAHGLGGRVEVVGAPGQGTEVKLSLPLRRQGRALDEGVDC